MAEVPIIDFWSHSSPSIYRRVVRYYAAAKPMTWILSRKYRKLAKGIAILLSHYRVPFREAVALLEKDCAIPPQPK